ncbi:DUF3822 family protein [Altibacter sp. HG106]|uniref:DUF3822 family protein n=1 Tax=Altibacter sp. HG106 TaxID=3023937 RepID=UPI002350E8AE|nr:DUF3822 family protein [Altibacter sp. HG106]MDC7996223.1 DUF3822 family protein [Altibacter sp. HG106]
MTLQTNNKHTTTSYKRLSVQISLTGLSFFVEDIATRTLLFSAEESFDGTRSPEEVLETIQHYFRKQEALQEPFENVVLIYNTPLYTLIPKALFDREKASEYLKFNAKILPNDYIAVDEVSIHESVVVYVPYINVNNHFFEKFGSFSYYHGITVVLTQCVKEERHDSGAKVIVKLMPASFDMLVFQQGALQLCNTYTYQTPEDFLYYLLFAMEQLSLNPDSVPIEIIADIDETDERYALAYAFIRNISIRSMATYQLAHTIA